MVSVPGHDKAPTFTNEKHPVNKLVQCIEGILNTHLLTDHYDAHRPGLSPYVLLVREIVTVQKGLHLGGHIKVVDRAGQNHAVRLVKLLHNPAGIILLGAGGQRGAIIVAETGIYFILSEDYLLRFHPKLLHFSKRLVDQKTGIPFQPGATSNGQYFQN